MEQATILALSIAIAMIFMALIWIWFGRDIARGDLQKLKNKFEKAERATQALVDKLAGPYLDGLDYENLVREAASELSKTGSIETVAYKRWQDFLADLQTSPPLFEAARKLISAAHEQIQTEFLDDHLGIVPNNGSFQM